LRPLNACELTPRCTTILSSGRWIRTGLAVFISDCSSLTDFGDETRVAEIEQKIREIYGVDVSDLKGGLVCEVLGRIGARMK